MFPAMSSWARRGSYPADGVADLPEGHWGPLREQGEDQKETGRRVGAGYRGDNSESKVRSTLAFVISSKGDGEASVIGIVMSTVGHQDFQSKVGLISRIQVAKVVHTGYFHMAVVQNGDMQMMGGAA